MIFFRKPISPTDPRDKVLGSFEAGFFGTMRERKRPTQQHERLASVGQPQWVSWPADEENSMRARGRAAMRRPARLRRAIRRAKRARRAPASPPYGKYRAHDQQREELKSVVDEKQHDRALLVEALRQFSVSAPVSAPPAISA
jgi:hypothetical protein